MTDGAVQGKLSNPHQKKDRLVVVVIAVVVILSADQVISRCHWFHSDGRRRRHPHCAVHVQGPGLGSVPARHANCPHNEKFPIPEGPEGPTTSPSLFAPGDGTQSQSQQQAEAESPSQMGNAEPVPEDDDQDENNHRRGGGNDIHELRISRDRRHGGGGRCVLECLRNMFRMSRRSVRSDRPWPSDEPNYRHERRRSRMVRRRSYSNDSSADCHSRCRRRASPQRHGTRRTRSVPGRRRRSPAHRSSRETRSTHSRHDRHDKTNQRRHHSVRSRQELARVGSGYTGLLDIAYELERRWPAQRVMTMAPSLQPMDHTRYIVDQAPADNNPVAPGDRLNTMRMTPGPMRDVPGETLPNYDDLDEDELFNRILQEERALDPVLRDFDSRRDAGA